jgi:3-deoxy-D-manno-octulosonic-acid transferase
MVLYFFYKLCSPLLWGVASAASLFIPKFRRRRRQEPTIWQHCVNNLNMVRGQREVVLFHAASAGEFEQLKPILSALDRSRYCVVQSFFSATIFEQEHKSPLFDAVCYHPIDTPGAARRFFMTLQPCAYIITRHDLWPAHLHTARTLGIRTLLINANLHDRSVRLRWWARGFNRWLFSQFDTITCGSQRLFDNIRALVPHAQLVITGDTRFDRIFSRKARNPANHFSEAIHHSRNIVLGSIIESDYDVVFGGLASFFPDGDKTLQLHKARIIIVPHEPAPPELERIEAILSGQGFRSCRYSQRDFNSEPGVIIVDVVGILADLYHYGALAYVGAGFGAGVHSVTEPAAYGCAVSYGPNIHILDEAIALNGCGAGTMVHSAQEFATFLGMLNNPSQLHEVQERTRQFMEQYQRCTQRTLAVIFGDQESEKPSPACSDGSF